MSVAKRIRLFAAWVTGAYLGWMYVEMGWVLALVMIGAWVTRLNDGRMVDVAWITVYLAALVWIAFEWWNWRRPRLRIGLQWPFRAT